MSILIDNLLRDPITKSRDSTIFIASSNSRPESKALANFICDGVNDNVEIQQAIDSLTDGGRIVLSEGQFNIGNTIVIKPKISLVGMGKQATVLFLQNGANTNMIQTLSDTLYWQSPYIANMTLNGNKANNPGSGYVVPKGILLMNCQHAVLENLEIYNFKDYGIALSGSSSSLYGLGLRIVNLNIENCFGGIWTGNYFYDLFITNSNIGNNSGGNGLVLPPGSLVSNCHIWGNLTGIYVSGDKVSITNSVIESISGHGIRIANDRVMVSNCLIQYCGGNGIFIDWHYHCIIKGNIIINNYSWGIYENGDKNIIIGNRFYNNSSGNIYKTGANTISVNNLEG